MIPADLASRLRSLLESGVQPVTQTQEIPAGLPRFEAGERFSALIQNALPDGSFQALVAGKTITLALPESVRSGDVLELIVTAQKNDTIFAQRAALTTPGTSAEAQSRPTLSQTGQLISQLLTGRFGSQESTPLQQTGQPLINAFPNPAELAQTLKEAVTQSGLFYESHLRQWADGKLSLNMVMQEPQAQHPPLQRPAQPNSFGTMPGTSQPVQVQLSSPTTPSGSENSQLPGVTTLPQEQADMMRKTADGLAHPQGSEDSTVYRQESTDSTGRANTARPVADSLMPIVQRQLDTLATHQMSWQGQVWPGVQMEWHIFDPEHPNSGQSSSGDNDDETAKFWRSSLRLNMPNLGHVDVRLVLGPQGLTLSIDTDRHGSAENMRIAGPRLHDALQSSGVELLQLKVIEHEEA